ncbi:hypothetical protein A9G33_09220 [Gilliamella sp. Choc3-5]|nr:hypothetical protein A9G33_09220 [Gilliamella apicola]
MFFYLFKNRSKQKQYQIKSSKNQLLINKSRFNSKKQVFDIYQINYKNQIKTIKKQNLPIKNIDNSKEKHRNIIFLKNCRQRILIIEIMKSSKYKTKITYKY